MEKKRAVLLDTIGSTGYYWYMETSVVTTITRKGQVTIPIEYRKELNLEEGDKVIFVQDNTDLKLRPIKSLESLKGVFKSAGRKYNKKKARESYIGNVIAGKI